MQRSSAAVRALRSISHFFFLGSGFDCLNLWQPCDNVTNTNQAWLTPDGAWCYSLGIGVSVRLVCQGMCDTFGVLTCADNFCTQGCVVNEEFKQALGLQIWDATLHLNNGRGQVRSSLVRLVSFAHALLIVSGRLLVWKRFAGHPWRGAGGLRALPGYSASASSAGRSVDNQDGQRDGTNVSWRLRCLHFDHYQSGP